MYEYVTAQTAQNEAHLSGQASHSNGGLCGSSDGPAGTESNCPHCRLRVSSRAGRWANEDDGM